MGRNWGATVLTQEQRALLPRCHGMRTNPPVTNNSYPEHIPEPDDWTFSESEPMPVAVKRGTAQIFTQSMLHSAWPNTDTGKLVLQKRLSGPAFYSVLHCFELFLGVFWGD